MSLGHYCFGRRSTGPVGPGYRPRVSSEHHPPRTGLQHAGHHGHHLLADVVSPAFDHHHRSIFEITNTLTGLLSWLHNPDLNLLARQKHWFERIGNVVQVDDADI